MEGMYFDREKITINYAVYKPVNKRLDCMLAPRREHLLDVALKLFNKHGFHATGVDKVQTESGVSKTTMYKYFKSKDDLIKAVLEKRHLEFERWVALRVTELSAERYEGEVDGKLYAVFDALTEWFHSDSFYGCNFINASAEFSDLTHPVHSYARDHKLGLAEFVARQFQTVPEEVRQELALDILLLIEGSIVCAHTSGLKDSAERAKHMMNVLLTHYRAKN